MARGASARLACRPATLLIALLGLGCATAVVPPWHTEPPPTALTEEDLRAEVLVALSQLVSRVGTAADEIGAQSERPLVRKRALLWKLRVIPYAQEAALLESPRRAYAELLGVAVLQRLYLTEGEGQGIFGEQQPIALEAVTAFEEDLRALGRGFLTASDLDRLVAELEADGRRRGIVGRDFAMPRRLDLGARARGAGGYPGAWLVEVPMAPFRAIGGVSEGAAAVRDFNDTALRFSAVVELLPEQIRWQTELLLFDLESRAVVLRGLEAAENLSRSALQISETADRLPQDLHELLSGSQQTLTDARAALRQAQEVAVPLRDAADRLAAASASWEAVLGRPREAGAEGRPFDVREWESALRETTRAAAELRGLAADLQALSRPGAAGAGQGVVRAVQEAQVGMRSVVDHAALRLAELGIGVFVLALLYRALAPRLARRTRD